MTAVLGERALNRALLERQWLLHRQPRSVDDAVTHLVGVQAQAPLAPYVGLWSRLDGFRPGALADRISDRRLVRATATLRTTIHLHTADDGLALRPVLRSVMEKAFRSSPFARNVVGMDLDAVTEAGRALLEVEPLTVAELSRRLGEEWPDRDPNSLAYAVRFLVPLVQVPPRGLWGTNGPARLATLESWLGRPMALAEAPDAWVLRYLRAFGPATVADIVTWSWLTGLREVVERLRPVLRTFRDEAGRELFDLPDAPLPDPETPAPVRFLPEYDNALLSHADRTRIVPAGRRVPLPPGNGAAIGTLLVDGFLRGTWRIIRKGAAATLVIEPDRPPEASDRAALEAEGHALLEFVASEATDREVRFADAGVTA